jgi:endonuclease/exonuclease/phosphatase family metal-dependent hydrolase
VKGYAWTGRARDNAESPEYCPIFYREERWHLSDYGTFWLSPQPNRMGLGWDAACVRIATWGKFRDGRKGNTVFVINTHLDHEGPEARVNGAAMIVQNMKDLAKGLPAILTGDFNCEPGSQAYETVTAAGLVDAHAGKWGKTFVGFARYPVKPIQIDYVFCNDKVKVLNADTVPAERNGRRMSDHRAIWADVAV